MVQANKYNISTARTVPEMINAKVFHGKLFIRSPGANHFPEARRISCSFPKPRSWIHNKRSGPSLSNLFPGRQEFQMSRFRYRIQPIQTGCRQLSGFRETFLKISRRSFEHRQKYAGADTNKNDGDHQDAIYQGKTAAGNIRIIHRITCTYMRTIYISHER